VEGVRGQGSLDFEAGALEHLWFFVDIAEGFVAFGGNLEREHVRAVLCYPSVKLHVLLLVWGEHSFPCVLIKFNDEAAKSICTVLGYEHGVAFFGLGCFF